MFMQCFIASKGGEYYAMTKKKWLLCLLHLCSMLITSTIELLLVAFAGRGALSVESRNHVIRDPSRFVLLGTREIST